MSNISLYNNLTPYSNLNSYKEWVKSIPNLTKQEEENLILDYERNHNLKAVEKLILSQLKTVVKIVYQYKNYHLPEEDLIQEGNVGLMKAIKKFQSLFNVRLFTYVSIWIKAEIQSYILNNWKIVKIATTNNLKKLFFNFRKLEQEANNNNISSIEINNYIKEKLNVSHSEVQEMQQYMHGGVIDIEEIENLLPNQDNQEKAYENLDTQKIYQAIELLNPNQALIIKEKFLSQLPKTNKEVAKQIGISSERVRQIEQSAIKILKKHLIN